MVAGRPVHVYFELDPKTKRDLWILPSEGAAAERKPIPFLRTEFNENASKLLRQREDVHGVAAAGRVRLGSQAHTEGSDRAATSRDGDILASVDRIRHGPADDL